MRSFTRPSLRTIRSVSRGFISSPPLAIGGGHLAICSGVARPRPPRRPGRSRRGRGRSRRSAKSPLAFADTPLAIISSSGIVELRVLVEAEALHVLDDRVARRACSPIWAKTVLTEFVSASVSVIGPKSSPPKFSSGTPLTSCGDDPSITVSGVNVAGVERRRGCHDLEGRARRIGAPASARLSSGLFGSRLSAPMSSGIEVRVVVGHRRHHAHLARARLDGHDRALAPGERRERGALGVHVEVRDDVVALARPVLEPGEDRLELVLLARERVVARALERRAGR